MAKGTPTPSRFPVPLRSSVPAEAAMLKELEEHKGEYGRINERMREWLIRGLKELEQRTQHVPSAGGDATSALVAVATELNSSVAVSQHFLSMYVQAKEAVASASRARPVTEPPTAMPPVSIPVPPPAAPVESLAPTTAKEDDNGPAASPVVSPGVEGSGTEAKPRWGHLKNLVGG
jgi:hypothetical protein